MTLTPETEAKLIRFATSRGLAPDEALEELLDEAQGEHAPKVDTRTPREKELDAVRAEQKARYRAKQEKLVADTLEGRRLKGQAEEKVA